MRNYGYGLVNELTPYQEVVQFCEREGRVPKYVNKKALKQSNNQTETTEPTVEQSTPSNPQSSPATDPLDEIKKLKGLLDIGAITQEEFDAKKKQLLDL